MLLAAIGMVATIRAENLLGTTWGYGQRQVTWWLLSLVLLLLLAGINFRRLCEWSYPIYAMALVLLVGVYFAPAINGSHRWIRVGPVGVQPSEFAKIATLMALARYLMYCDRQRHLRGLFVPFLLAVVPLLLVLREPDLGTALVFLPVLFAMLVAAGARPRDLAVAALVGVFLLPLLWQQMSREQRSRITALWEQTGPYEKPSADGYHLHQAKQVSALGGTWGSIVTGDITCEREVYHLPIAQSDFIFSVIGERCGLWGTGLTLFLFAVLIHQLLAIGRKTREPFGRLVCVGVAALFAVEVLVNTAMTVGLAPVTGLSLPLVSYGGSGLIAHVCALGVVASVARYPGYEVGPAPFRFSRDQASAHAFGRHRVA
jgi:cell division protein FtsW (lipid II flippase)